PGLKKGEVRLKVHYSSLNYKDALAVTGAGKILKKFPLIPGIDLAGVVEESADERFKSGDNVFATGMGLGESINGGYCTETIVQADVLLSCPPTWSLADVMTLGTAGFTAGLCLSRMEQLGQRPDMGPIVITGASGGV